MTFIRAFDSLSKNDTAIAGGKGASLGEMTQAGIFVPPGFVILTNAFETFLKEADLAQEIEAILGNVDAHIMHTIEKASADIQALILRSSIPTTMVHEIEDAFRALNVPYVAVRSSATAEDGTEHAWAGQLDSFLNTTENTLLLHVQKCWASLFTPRAIFYRFEKGLRTHSVGVAVVVQAMVVSEKSGIAFSVHPVTEDPDQLIIEAGFGLGEAIVSGQITPDSYVVSKSKHIPLDINVHEQSRGLFRKDGGGSGWQELGDAGKKQVLNTNEILELSGLIQKIETHYGFPVDIEWAYEQGQFYIVQSRPITTLANHKDGDMVEVDADNGVVRVLKTNSLPGDMLLNNTWEPHDAPAVLFTLYAFLDAGIGRLKEVLGDSYKIFSVHFKNNQCRFGFSEQDLWQLGANVYYSAKTDKKFLKTLERNMEKAFADFERVLKNFDAKDYLQNLSNIELHKYFVSFYQAYTRAYAIPIVANALDSYTQKILIETVQSFSKSEPEAVEGLYLLNTPTVRSYTTEAENSLLRIGAKIESSKTLQQVFRKGDSEKAFEQLQKNKSLFNALKKHAKEYFWIENNYAHAKVLTRKDFVEPLVDIFASGLSPKNMLRSNQKEFVNSVYARKEFIKKHSKHFDSVVLVLSEFAVYARDIRKKYNQIGNHYLFLFLQEAAQRFNVPANLIAYSTPAEFAALVQKGSIDTNLLQERSLQPFIVFATEGGTQFLYEQEALRVYKEMYPAVQVNNESLLKGAQASRGKASGRVRIILKPSEFARMSEGDILVTTMTRPEFVPLMKKASAIVTDEGGVTSHAAIVSRELKKPCIIGTKIATQVLHDGDMVEVDADNGVVRVLKKQTSMSQGEIIEAIRAITWERGYERPFYAFLASFFEDAGSKESFEKIGILNVELKAQLFQNTMWYVNKEILLEMGAQIALHLKQHGMSSVVDSLKKHERESIQVIDVLITSKDMSAEEKFARVYEIMQTCCTYLWLAHGVEAYYRKLLDTEVPKYVSDDIETFIGNASIPSQKNEHALFEDALRSSLTPEQIAAEFAWLKVYDGFSEGFTSADIEAMRKNIRPENPKHEIPPIPKEIDSLLREVQYLVYFRTARSDVWRKLMYHARPIFQELASTHNIPFTALQFYRARPFTNGLSEKYDAHFTFANVQGSSLFLNGNIITENVPPATESLQGTVAYRGKVRGSVKIVKSPEDIHRVLKNDILVAQMTFPAFMPGLILASAFVTDEGGITCHAAIIAREMQKPCIIGAKIATQVLHDGDMVEVDADNGVVRVLHSANK